MGLVFLWGFLFLQLLVFEPAAVHGARRTRGGSDKTCEPDSHDPCKCKVDGKTLDISGFYHWPKRDIIHEQYAYTYSPCDEIACGDEQTHACQLKPGEEGFHFSLSEGVKSWTIHSMKPLNFTIDYQGHEGGDKTVRSTSVLFTQGPSDDTVTYVSEDKQNVYKYNYLKPDFYQGNCLNYLYGSYATVTCICKCQESDFLHMAFASLITYFVAGGLINYFHRGARGAEVIPNWSFWKDLPFLIKDGFMFTISPCYKGASKSYHSI